MRKKLLNEAQTLKRKALVVKFQKAVKFAVD
jgi:hypothetical protein